MADRAVLAWALRQPARWTVKDAEDGLKNRYCTRMVRKVVAAGVAAGTFALALRKRGNELLYELPCQRQQVRGVRAAHQPRGRAVPTSPSPLTLLAPSSWPPSARPATARPPSPLGP